MDTLETVTRIFEGNGDIPLRLNVPIRIPIEDFETENIKVVNCYTSGRTIPYLLNNIEYGLNNLLFLHYKRA